MPDYGIGRWFHTKRFIGKPFTGTYERDRKGERVFILTYKKTRKTFESFQAAKKLGWSLYE